ncbi:MAG TPA: histidine phosphatase family protein [Candidatus Yaniella excrementavium]|nr:histidine phosphatase family protein [Candidatus Yaniella excrementavium]
MKNLLKVTSLSLAALLLASCAGTSEADSEIGTVDANEQHPEFADMSHDELVEAAEKEGEVVVYAFTSRIATVAEEFEAAYPQIDIVAHDISSSEQIERLRSEHDAGAETADVAYVSDAPVVWNELLSDGVLQRYVPERVEDELDDQYKDPLLTNRLSTKVLMYNEEANPDGAPVENLWELTEDKWASKVVMVDPTQRGDCLDLLTEMVLRADEMAAAYEEHFGEPIELDEGNENAGYQYIADLYANDVILLSSTDDVNEAVGATGQEDAPVGFTSYSDRRDPPGAEPRVELVERVAAALQDESVPAGNVLVVTHGGVIRAALDAFIGLKTENIVPVSPASLTVVEVTAGDLVQAKLQHYNLSPSSKNIQLQPEAR